MRSKTKTIALEQDYVAMRLLMLGFLAVAIYFCLGDLALAVTGRNSAMGDRLCDIVEFAYGNMGRGFATLAIIILGVGAMLGKVSWGLAILVSVGIALVFNADVILTAMSSSSNNCA